jgi:hypothetical protein
VGFKSELLFVLKQNIYKLEITGFMLVGIIEPTTHVYVDWGHSAMGQEWSILYSTVSINSNHKNSI